MANVLVGLSGGVDSSVTAKLLCDQGHQVTGVYMSNWPHDPKDPHCQAEQDYTDAATIAQQLNIPLHRVDFSKAYWDEVFSHCLDEFAQGRTPNPDVWCNQRIKFKHLLNYALKQQFDVLATGHYARIIRDTPSGHQLHQGIDPKKDQSYFLYLLNQHALAHSLFPLGDYRKTQIRAMARQWGLATCEKKDSTGICFIGERRFSQLLNEFLLARPGNIEDEQGRVLGQHMGIMFYTLGQRKGLNIGGQAGYAQAPWFVIDKRIADNVLVVAQGSDHPRLMHRALSASQTHWINSINLDQPIACSAKIRHLQADQCCRAHTPQPGQLTVQFTAAQKAITPGQSVVLYQHSQCLGGAIIDSTCQMGAPL